MSFWGSTVYHKRQWRKSKKPLDEWDMPTIQNYHSNSTALHLHINGVVEAYNKNIKRVLRQMIENYKSLHENLPYGLLGYRTTIQTSTGETS